MTASSDQPTPSSTTPPPRLVSLDAYRGLIMLLLASSSFGIGAVAAEMQGGFWPVLGQQADHAHWAGCTLWDFIQPAFMFMVGVAIPYSYARREQMGHGTARIVGHALSRAVILVLLSIFLVSAYGQPQTNFLFNNVLAQIGLGYVFVVLLRNRGVTVQAAVALAILAGYWLAFCIYPSPQPEAFDRAAYGLDESWPLFSGLAAHWNIHENFAGWFDRWFLNLFPRQKPFMYERGGYQTLNFVPSIATMIFGLMAGQLLRSPRKPRAKLAILVLAGVALLAAGLIVSWTGCPIVKRIWTPSWALVSGGCVVWILAAIYAVVDVAGYRRWTFPLVVVGMNPMVMYMMFQLLCGWTWHMLNVHFGGLARSAAVQSMLCFLLGPDGFDPVYLPIVRSLSVLLAFWLVCWWLYRQRIFVRL
jgi:heparan-alpha-glucosaminide N-acetyltransferase